MEVSQMRMLVATAIVAGLGIGPAFAQGLPSSMSAPAYGTKSFQNVSYHHSYHHRTVFSELFRGSHPEQGKAGRSAEQTPQE
jgi:hypothetical protein